MGSSARTALHCDVDLVHTTKHRTLDKMVKDLCLFFDALLCDLSDGEVF